jgi:D-sedoheptulose 7-phosphate isomerase
MIKDFLQEIRDVIDRINPDEIRQVTDVIAGIRSHGRLFIVGSGGGAAHASHAACDFRKLCGIESYAPYDNVTELTARTNDEGWEMSVVGYLQASKFNCNDCLFVFSVGGGSDKVSLNLSQAIIYAHAVGAKVVGIVGREKCTLTEFANAWVVIQSKFMTPVVEGLQSVIHHLIVTKLQINKTVW